MTQKKSQLCDLLDEATRKGYKIEMSAEEVCITKIRMSFDVTKIKDHPGRTFHAETITPSGNESSMGEKLRDLINRMDKFKEAMNGF